MAKKDLPYRYKQARTLCLAGILFTVGIMLFFTYYGQYDFILKFFEFGFFIWFEFLLIFLLIPLIIIIVLFLVFIYLDPNDFIDPPGSYVGPRGELYTPISISKKSLSSVEQLEKLVKLYDKGIINDAEFEEQKLKILNE